jgi:NhaA family Na+:H+ antiporter
VAVRDRTRTEALRAFLASEVAGGLVLLAAAAVALAWASSPWSESYADLWHIELTIGPVREDLGHWVNDLLMALFFFVIGIEIKRELLTGDLRDPRRAALPVAAAVGGMLVPAAIYVVFNTGRSGVDGWGIPMATDIAFALGVLALLGPRVPTTLKVFLLALAIVDDLGAIGVIAIFYSDDIGLGWLGLAASSLAAIWLLWRVGVRSLAPHVALGIVTWWFVFESGVHATLAGVAVALLLPVDLGDDVEHVLHPFTSFLVVPLFALANAGVDLNPDALSGEDAQMVAAGVAVGLVAGKIFGIAGTVWLAVRLGLGNLPDGTTWRHILGAAGVAGIGFTVSLFVAGLAFDDGALVDAAKLGILGGSALAAVIGSLVLYTAAPATREDLPEEYVS